MKTNKQDIRNQVLKELDTILDNLEDDGIEFYNSPESKRLDKKPHYDAITKDGYICRFNIKLKVSVYENTIKSTTSSA